MDEIDKYPRMGFPSAGVPIASNSLLHTLSGRSLPPKPMQSNTKTTLINTALQ